MVVNFLSVISLKVLSALIALMMVPLLISRLGVDDYGIWVALISIFGWINVFDFGCGHALKNSVSKAVASNNFYNAKMEFSQLFKFVFFISLGVLIVFFTVVDFFSLFEGNLLIVVVIFFPAIVLFPFSMCGMVLQGAKKIFIHALFVFIVPLGMFGFVAFLEYFDFSLSLLRLALAFTGVSFVSLFLIVTASSNVLSLSLSEFFKLLGVGFPSERLFLGGKFFIIQLSSIVLYSSGPVIIYHFLSSGSVTKFDILSKIFVFGLGFFQVGISVFWPEIVCAKELGLYGRIRKVYYFMLLMSFVFFLLSVFFVYNIKAVVSYWVGDVISVDEKEAFYFALLVSIQAIAYAGAVVLNAFEKLNIQLILSVIATLCMVPLTIIFVEVGYGIVAVPFSALLLTLLPMFYCNVHAYLLIRKEDDVV